MYFRGVGWGGCFGEKRAVFRAFLRGMGWGILVEKGHLKGKTEVILGVKKCDFLGGKWIIFVCKLLFFFDG